MSMNYNQNPQGSSADIDSPEGETSVFAATPIWERSGKKRRGATVRSVSGSKTPNAVVAETQPVIAPGHDSTLTREAASYRAAPPYGGGYGTTTAEPLTSREETTDSIVAAPRTRAAPAKRSGVPAAALAAGVVALGGLAAAGIYATQPRDSGIAELSPGVPTEVAALEAAPQGGPPLIAAAPPASTTQADVRPAPARDAAVSRVRPAATASAAGDVGLDASAAATLPTGPMPYSSMNGGDTAASPTAATDTPAALTPSPATPETIAPAPSIAPEAVAPEVAPPSGADATQP